MENREIYERILEEIEGYSYTVHRKDEKDYAYLGEEGFCIEVFNESGNPDDDLFIESDGKKALLYFANNKEIYAPEFDDDLYFLLKDIGSILNRKKYSVSMYYHADEFMKCLSGGFVSAKDVENKDIEEIFRYLYMDEDLANKIEVNGGRVDFRCWDVSGNRTVAIEKKTKH